MTTTTAHSARASQAATQPGKARWTRVAATGLVLAGLAPAVAIVLAIAFGMELGPTLTFLGPPTLVAWIAAALVWRFGTWAKAVGISRASWSAACCSSSRSAWPSRRRSATSCPVCCCRWA